MKLQKVNKIISNATTKMIWLRHHRKGVNEKAVLSTVGYVSRDHKFSIGQFLCKCSVQIHRTTRLSLRLHLNLDYAKIDISFKSPSSVYLSLISN